MYLVLRTETFAKLFFLISCTGLFLYAILAFYTFHTAYTTISQKPQEFINLQNFEIDFNNNVEFDTDLKHILFWTQTGHVNDLTYTLIEGQQLFTDHRCDFANCFVTTNKTLLRNDYTNFDAIVFNISLIKNWLKVNMPQRRSVRQKYVFYSMESPDEAAVCNVKADSYFNWTWSYKLNSDIVSPFIEVTDLQGNIVAPKIHVDWSTNYSMLMEEEIHTKSNQKKKTIAWIVEKCNERSDREAFVKELQAEFKLNLLDFDIYGCGNLQCPRGECSDVINKYYFYLVYEHSVAEDYVTKEVIKAYNNGAVPVILGGADYKKFLPDGSYVEAHSMSADNIAAKIGYIVRNPYIYHSYFVWKKIYSIHETEDFKGICELCAYLNNKKKLKSFSTYKKFRKWWYPGPLHNKCIPKGAENLSEVLAYINSSVHL